MTRHLAVSLLSVVTIFVATSVQADIWPQYRGPLGNGKSSERLGDSLEAKEIWKKPTPLGFSSFSVADGRAFTLVANDDKLEELVAMSASSGDVLWRKELGSSDYDHGGGNAGARDNKGGDGPRSTPSTDGERVYVYDSHLLLSCYDAKSGDLVWKHDIVEEYDGRNIKWLNATSPLLDGDRLYITGGGEGQSFLAFKAATGDLIWKSGDETMTHATPHLTTINGKNQLVFFMKSGLVGVDPENGEELWRRKFNFSVSTAASPITEGNLVYCSAGYGVGAGLFKVTDQPEAEKVWLKRNKLMNHWSTPLVLDGHIYGIFEFKKYGTAPLQCVDMKSGEIIWSERGFGPGNCILVGDKLIVLSDAGELVIVAATPEGYKELSRKKVVEGKCWSTPAYSDGRVYVRSTTEGACLELSSS